MSLQENSFIQYEKNYSLLKKKFQRMIVASLDFEYIQNIYFSMVSDSNIAANIVSLEFEEKSQILLGILSIYEVAQNLSHFEFV